MPRTAPSPLAVQVAATIIELGKQRGLVAGDHLREEAFAQDVGVSRSPIRKAFAVLEQLGAVRKEPNRGYFLLKDAARISVSGTFGGDPGEELYRRIVEDRLDGDLPPTIFEAELLRRYGAARGLLLKVLGRMAREGVVERRRGHGWEFSALLASAEAHDQSYRFRMAIEPAALLEPGYKVDPAAFARIRQQQQSMIDGGIFRFSRTRLFEIGAEFHETIVRCSGNAFFLEAIQRQNRLRRLVEYRTNRQRSRLAAQCREHLKLLDLLEAGRREEAADFLRQHLDVVRNIKVTQGRKARESRRVASETRP